MSPTSIGLVFKNNADIKGTNSNYGSYLYNKKFDCNDGLYKINVYFEKLGNAIIIARFYDE